MWWWVVHHDEEGFLPFTGSDVSLRIPQIYQENPVLLACDWLTISGLVYVRDGIFLEATWTSQLLQVWITCQSSFFFGSAKIDFWKLHLLNASTNDASHHLLTLQRWLIRKSDIKIASESKWFIFSLFASRVYAEADFFCRNTWIGLTSATAWKLIWRNPLPPPSPPPPRGMDQIICLGPGFGGGWLGGVGGGS